jgi:hypothetical protein
MSEDNRYDQFLRAARAEHEANGMPEASARRIERGIAPHVSWRRGLPASIAAALATLAAATDARARAGAADGTSKTTGSFMRSSWTKGIAMLVPVLGLATAFYTVESASPPPPPPPPTSTPTAIPASVPEGPSGFVAPVATLAGPRDLPDARSATSSTTALAPSTKASALRRDRSGDAAFEAELALLTEVTSALREKRPSRALALIDEHDRRFPSGVLVPEFAGERVLTLAALGRQAEACDLSAKFLAQYPKSPIVAEVRSSCVESTPDR